MYSVVSLLICLLYFEVSAQTIPSITIPAILDNQVTLLNNWVNANDFTCLEMKLNA